MDSKGLLLVFYNERKCMVKDFHKTVMLLRDFFVKKGFIEVHPQSRLSILAACEDPSTIGTFDYNGDTWPLPQTGQMWLEYELLKTPKEMGFFCVSTSYRNEPDPIEGRHDLIFPMFEFEMHGGMTDLIKLEEELLKYIGFGRYPFGHISYKEATYICGTEHIGYKEEGRLNEFLSHVTFLKDFPETSSPFWNMKRNGNTANKVDVIIHGMETIGSAEREIDKNTMRERFLTISDGEYAKLLFEKFGHDSVMRELDKFLEFDFFPRSGGGIGMTRMISALKKSSII